MLRDFLMTTRAVDPVELERVRIEHMTLGYSRAVPARARHAGQVRPRRACASSLRHSARRSCARRAVARDHPRRIAQDDDLQAVFFRNLVSASLDATPIAGPCHRRPIADFAIPVVELPGRGNSTALLAKAGIYDAELERSEVFPPLLEHGTCSVAPISAPMAQKARDEIASVVALTS